MNNEAMKKVINKLDNEFTDWTQREQILPSRLEIFAAGYLAGVKNSKIFLNDLFIDEMNKRVENEKLY
jgi:hypothetical protein